MTSRGRGWRTLVASGSLVVVGAAAGIAADRLLHRDRPENALLQQIRDDPMGVIDSVIDLRPEQRQRISAILAERQRAIDAVWLDTHLRLQSTVDSVVEEIAAVLDTGQAERFRALVVEAHRPVQGSHR